MAELTTSPRINLAELIQNLPEGFRRSEDHLGFVLSHPESTPNSGNDLYSRGSWQIIKGMHTSEDRAGTCAWTGAEPWDAP